MAIVQQIGVTKGPKVLDLGCGDGTSAIPAARLGAEVLGVDIASNQITGKDTSSIPATFLRVTVSRPRIGVS